ncbi:MAG: Rmf/CrpP family protein [Planctomycetota bacterium]
MDVNLKRRQQAAIDRAKAQREGRRYAAFFEGHRAFQEGRDVDACPHRAGPLATAWRNGWRYAEAES